MIQIPRPPPMPWIRTASRAGHRTAQATMSETATQAKVRQGGRRSRNLGEDRMARLMKAAKIVARMTAGTPTHSSNLPRSSAGGGAAAEAPVTITASIGMGNADVITSPRIVELIRLEARDRHNHKDTKTQRKTQMETFVRSFVTSCLRGSIWRSSRVGAPQSNRCHQGPNWNLDVFSIIPFWSAGDVGAR